jgi:hypothetical protein
MSFEPADIVFVLALAIFVWLVIQIIDGDSDGGKRARVPV